MADDAIVFAMANPTPEIAPEDLLAGQASPSSRPGAPTTRTRSTTCSRSPASSAARSTSAPSTITEGMKVAAGHALAAVIPADELGPEYVIPSVFNRDVAPAVAAAVAEAAERDGVARRSRT